MLLTTNTKIYVCFLSYFYKLVVTKGMHLHPKTTVKVELAETQPSFYGGSVSEILS